MADQTPEELLPSLEPEDAPQEPLPVEEAEESSSFVGALIGGAGGTIFFRNDDVLENDKKYRQIVEKKVAIWQTGHPGIFNDKIFIKRRIDGQPVLNPELEKFIPSLKPSAYSEFKTLYPNAAARYEKLEAKRIYHSDFRLDPEIQKLESQINQGLPQRFWNPSGQQRPNEELRQEEKEEKYRQFTQRFPEKAKYYSRFDSDMKKAYQEHAEAQWTKMGRSQRILTRLYDPLSVPESQKKAWMPKRLRALSDRYDNWKLNTGSRISQRYQSSLLGRSAARYTRFMDRLFKPIDYLQNTTDRAINYFTNQALRPVNWVKNKALGAGRKIVGKLFNALAKKMPGLAGMIARGLLGAKQLIGGALRDGFRGLSRLTGQLLKKTARFAAQAAARVVGMAAVFTMPAWSWFAIAAAIVGGIILIILIILMIIHRNELSGEVRVDIQKSGPSVTPNPVPGGENLITYTINVSYSGPVGSVTIVDTLPPETDYVSSTGPVQGVVSGNIVTWNIPISGSGTSGTATPGGAAGTIQNMGFGPSDAARIDNLIRNLRPGSPLIGHGDDIIRYAQEFNVDPLMVILFLNESGFCADNGVVSPGGSNPDNYNCGGITWPAAQSATDTGRWSARAGPSANGHVFTFVPTPEDGIGLFFDYLGGNSLYVGKTLGEFYDIYNPCSDPGNGGQFACGAEAMQDMLNTLSENLN